MSLRTGIAGFLLIGFASGCFRWAPMATSSLSAGEKVRIEAKGGPIVLDDANVCHVEDGAILVAGTSQESRADQNTSCQCMYPPCKAVDVTNAEVAVKRLNVGATAAIIALSTLATVASVTFGVVIIIILSTAARPVLDSP